MSCLPSHRIFGRYNWSRNEGLNGTFTGVGTGVIDNNGTEKDRTHTAVVNLNSVFSPTLLNEFRWQYSYEERPRVNNNEADDFVSKVGPQFASRPAAVSSEVCRSFRFKQYDDRWQFTDNLSIIKGAHNVKVGFDYNHSFVDQIFRGNWRGVYIFNTIDNFVRARNKQINPATNQPYTADQYRLFFGDGAFAAGVNEFATYIQDTYKVSPRLTINLGFRHEAFLMPQPTRPNPLVPQSSSIPSDKAMWQPRAGITYDFTGDGKTVLKVGGGFFTAGRRCF